MDNLTIGAALLVWTLSGCNGAKPDTSDQPLHSSGTGAVSGAGQGGITPPPAVSTSKPPTAGVRANNTAGSAPSAGSAPTAGRAPTATAGGSPTASTPTTAGSAATATAGSGTGGATAAVAGMSAGNAGAMGAGACCKGGDCLCHGDPPAAPTNSPGPFKTAMYDIASAGCVFYPMDAEPPYAAVTISDGFGGSGGCGLSQTNEWGPLYASWGIVAMIIHTGAGDQPAQRGMKLTAGIAAFKMENDKSDSPLKGKLSGRYGTSGFSMGGGGTTFSAEMDPTLKTDVAIMAWGPTSGAIMVPSLFIFGSADTLAGTMGMGPYMKIADTVPKMAVTINSGHAGQPSSGGGGSGKAGLAFQKVYLEGDERWKPILAMVMATATNIK